MSLDIRLADFESTDFEPMRDLFASHFPPEHKLLTRVYSEWLYRANPAGPAKMVRIVEEGRWIAFMGMIPVDLLAGTHPLPGFFVVNVLVHPQHQGRFLFGRMVTEAKRFVGDQMVLMGHPNALALKTWQRARMIFQPDWRPFLFLPGWRGFGYTAEDISAAASLEGLFPSGIFSPGEPEGIRQRMDVPFLRWRFFEQPFQTYRIQLLRFEERPVGLLISRRHSWLVNLLMDVLVPSAHWRAGVHCLPLGTCGFFSEAGSQGIGRNAWALPVAKPKPFFLSHQGGWDIAGRPIHLGLSVTDF